MLAPRASLPPKTSGSSSNIVTYINCILNQYLFDLVLPHKIIKSVSKSQLNVNQEIIKITRKTEKHNFQKQKQ